MDRLPRAVWLLLLIGSVLALAGCAGDDGDDGAVDQEDEDGTEAEAEDEADGDETDGDEPDVAIDRDAEIRIAWPGPASTLDPHMEPHTGARPYLFQVWDRLTYANADMEIEPMLATSWEFSEQGDYLDMQLRDDVTFHDGTPFTAEAVQASIQRAQTLEGSTQARHLEAITEVEVLADHEVRFHLDGPAAELPAIFATPAGAMISPEAIEQGRSLSEDPGDAGSGPFVVEEFEPNDRTVFARADDYWDPDAHLVARQSQTWIREPAPRMSALRAGEVDMIMILPDQIPQARELHESGEFKMTVHDPVANHVAFFTRNNQSEFGDERVRQALNHAIDREQLISTLLNDGCEITWQTWPEGTMGHNPEIGEAYPYDPDRARELLAEAGLEDGFSFESMVGAGGQPEQVAEAIQAMLADIGVDMQITPISSTEAVQTYAEGDIEAFTHVFTGHPDPAEGIGRFIAPDSQYGQLRGLEDEYPNILELAEQGRDQTLSNEERGAVYQELAAEIVDGSIYIPICFRPNPFVSVPEILNVDEMSYAWGGIFDPRYLQVADE